MMNYEQMMAAYNGLTQKLLIKSVISNNILNLPCGDVGRFFCEHGFFNRTLSYNENRRIKLTLQKELNYTGTVIFGNVSGDMIYRAEILYPNQTYKEYETFYPYGCPRNYVHNKLRESFRYDFLSEYYTLRTFSGVTEISSRHFTYKDNPIGLAPYIGRLYTKYPNVFQSDIVYASGACSTLTLFLTSEQKKYSIFSIIAAENLTDIVRTNYIPQTKELRLLI